jgi:hypothetical protein
MRPSVTRMVHYVARGSADGVYPAVCRAAVITEVCEPPEAGAWFEPVSLCVLNPTGIFFHERVLHDEAILDNGQHGAGGTWHWPEKVE